MGVRVSIYSRMCTGKVLDKRHSSEWHRSMPRTKQLQPTSKNNFDHGVRFKVWFSWKSSTNSRCFSFTRVISLRPFSFSVFLLSFFRAPFFILFHMGEESTTNVNESSDSHEQKFLSFRRGHEVRRTDFPTAVNQDRSMTFFHERSTPLSLLFAKPTPLLDLPSTLVEIFSPFYNPLIFLFSSRPLGSRLRL